MNPELRRLAQRHERKWLRRRGLGRRQLDWECREVLRQWAYAQARLDVADLGAGREPAELRWQTAQQNSVERLHRRLCQLLEEHEL